MNVSFLDNIETKKVRVGDIDIAYKIFGKGEPLFLIPGFSQPMDTWDPIVLEKLSSNHTIIISDYRGKLLSVIKHGPQNNLLTILLV
jgi:pimeloyl-ACP methyl ester carboxylesterase